MTICNRSCREAWHDVVNDALERGYKYFNLV